MLLGIALLFIFLYQECNQYHLRGHPDCIAGHIALIALTVLLIVSL